MGIRGADVGRNAAAALWWQTTWMRKPLTAAACSEAMRTKLAALRRPGNTYGMRARVLSRRPFRRVQCPSGSPSFGRRGLGEPAHTWSDL